MVGKKVVIRDGSNFNGKIAVVVRPWIERGDEGTTQMGWVVNAPSNSPDREGSFVEWGLEYHEYDHYE